MKKIFVIALTTLISGAAFADVNTAYNCSAIIDNPSAPAEVSVQGVYTAAGAIKQPVRVFVNSELITEFRGTSGMLSDGVISLDAIKDSSKLELRHFTLSNGGSDPKNYLEFDAKVDGHPQVYKTKAVTCTRQKI